MIKLMLMLLLVPGIALGQNLLATQDFESAGWETQFTGEASWGDNITRTANEPASGSYCVRWNQDATRTDPITGLVGIGSSLFDWRGGIDLVAQTPNEMYFSMKFRHDDYHNESDGGDSPRKLFYITDETYGIQGMYFRSQQGTDGIGLVYANGGYSDQWARDNWGYSTMPLTAASDSAGLDGEWRKIDMYWNYDENYVMVWMDGELLMPAHATYIANYPAEASEGKIIWEPGFDLHTQGIQIMYFDQSRDLLNEADETGYAAGVQIDDLEYWDGIPLGTPSVSSVTGDVLHGTSIFLFGNSFGSKSPAVPIKYEDFEGGVLGESVATTGYWSTDGTPPVFSDNSQRFPGSNNALCALTGLQDMFYIANVAITDKIYVNYRYRVEPAPESTYQLKIWGVGQTFPTIVYPGIGDFLWEHSDSKSRYLQIYGTDSVQEVSYGNWPAEYTWESLSMEISQGTVGGADGIITAFQNCVQTMEWTDANLRVDVGDNLDSFKWGQYLGNGGSSTIAQYDDVYIDNTWARIELGDNPNYSSCTHREIQVPSAWSPTSVTVTVNTGSFSTSDSAYLFVVNEDGTPSVGYPVTIGESGGGGGPMTGPTNLTASGGH